jgi:hypothetical protein
MKVESIVFLLLDTCQRLFAYRTANIGIIRVEPKFKLVHGMLALGLVHDANTTNMRVVNLALHDAVRQLLPVAIQELGWKVVLGIQFARVVVVIFPFRGNALFE